MTPTNDDIQLSAQEAKQLEQAFQDKSFRKLLSEYMNELSNPEYREETEAYIRHLEQQDELPEGKMLIRPTAGFVVKFQQKKLLRENQNSKLFLNVVYAEEIAKPTSNEAPKEGTGQNWTVPFALGPLRMEADKRGDLVSTFDCCFHPTSLLFARCNQSFCKLIIDIAKDAVQKSFLASGDETELADDCKILKRAQYKSGKPKTMMIAARESKPMPNDVKYKVAAPPRAAGKVTKAEEVSKTTKRDSLSLKETAEVKAKMAAAPSSVITPEFIIVERGNFEIADHTTMINKPISHRPKELVINITLDQLMSAHDIDLDVGEKALHLNTKKSPINYYLDVVLPYPVNSKNGSARFDKKQSKLIVTLPVMRS